MSRPNHIEDALVRMHTGQWFGFFDPSNKVYANLIVHDDSITKPTEAEVNAKLAELQAQWDADNAEYKLDRAKAYPADEDQPDQIYQEGIDAWKETIAAVKAEYPKP
jgi:hypothetical protein